MLHPFKSVHLVLLIICVFIAEISWAQLSSLCYHDVKSGVDGSLDSDPMAVDIRNLADHFEWLRQSGYQPVSMQQIEDARNGTGSLPDKPILLTFDDGYSSFYTQIFPLLKQYKYPAVMALVTNWLEVPDSESVRYGNQLKPRSDFLSWEQVREMQESGLVEIASHTHNSHKGIPANPQGNMQPAMVTRRYLGSSSSNNSLHQYESDTQYRKRIHEDLEASRDIIKRNTGKAPDTIVWPYGMYNQTTWEIAQSLGFSNSLTLAEGHSADASQQHLHRHLMVKNPKVTELYDYLQKPISTPAVRMIQVDLDYVYDEDKEQQQRNLDKLVQRIANLKINTIYLQAFSDPDGDGHADSLYFPNRHLPVRGDLFSHAAWQLKTRAGVNVFAWMPVSSFVLPTPNDNWMVISRSRSGENKVSDYHYRRLSIFHPEARQWIDQIYQDLGRYTSIDGILFHDDGLLGDQEDLNPYAIQYYEENGFTRFSIKELHQLPYGLYRWGLLKTRALIDFTLDRAATVRRERPEIKTARNLFSRPALEAESQQWFAQSLESFLHNYDHTAIMAMPWMEQAKSPHDWLKKLTQKSLAITQLTNAPGKLIFELQTRDWNTGKAIPDQTISTQMEWLQQNGIRNIGYYPDDFTKNTPDINTIKPAFSLQDYPWSVH